MKTELIQIMRLNQRILRKLLVNMHMPENERDYIECLLAEHNELLRDLKSGSSAESEKSKTGI